MIKKIGKVFASATLAAACLIGVSACGSSDTTTEDDGTLTTTTGLTGGVAATVNGVEIPEDKITKYINNIRINYSLDDDSTFASYLSMYGYTPESLRDNILESYIDQELIKQYASDKDVSTDDDEIDSYLNKVKDQYSSDEAWESALQSSGYDDEQGYRDDLEYLILNKKLGEVFEEEAETSTSDDVILEEAQSDISTYDGSKRSSHILFSSDDQELAQQVLDQIKAGEISFDDAVSQYSTDTSSAANGGDVGWDSINTFVTDYQTGLDALSVGEISDLVESDYGYHIIKCTDEYVAPEELTSLDGIPEDILAEIKTSATSTNANTLYSDWLEEKNDEADIVINDMPENVPYNVDMSSTEDDSDEEATDEEADEELVEDVATEEQEVTEEEVESDSTETTETASSDSSTSSSSSSSN
jgi:foldase protein PrsA